MNYIAVTLFEHPDEAREGMNALRENGFDTSNIEHIESDPDSQNFFHRVFTRKGGEEFEAEQTMDVLTDMGLDEDDAKGYAKKVKRGHSLVVTRCRTESEARKARQILDEYPFGAEEEEKPTPAAEHIGGERIGEPKQPGFESSAGAAHVEGESDIEDRPERMGGAAGAGDELRTSTGASEREELEPQEEYLEPSGYSTETGEAGDQREFTTTNEENQPVGTGTEEGHTGKGQGQPHIGLAGESAPIEEMTRRSESRFNEFEEDCRRHFDENLSDTGISFDEYSRGYRFGMALGEDENLRDFNWELVEPEAGREWESQEGTAWDNFKESVRFGWYKVRGQKEQYERHSPNR